MPLATLAVESVIIYWLSFQMEGATAPLPVVKRHRFVAQHACVCVFYCVVFTRELSQLYSELHDKPFCNFLFHRMHLKIRIVSFPYCSLLFYVLFRFQIFFVIIV